MLNILFNIGRKKTLEEMALQIQKGDNELQNDLIEKYKPFIAKAVSSVCKRYILETDDEFSIGLIAFNEAIEKYTREKGSSLLSFAELIIKRRVIDHIRKEARTQSQVFYFEATDGGNGEVAQTKLEASRSIDEYINQMEQQLRTEEILHFQRELKTFGLTFNEIVEQSPKHSDARQNAIEVAKVIIEAEHLRELLFKKKKLPVRLIEQHVTVSRKTIERNRKYIIAIAVVLAGDYIYLKDYLKGVLDS